jgi:hypothetical protein
LFSNHKHRATQCPGGNAGTHSAKKHRATIYHQILSGWDASSACQLFQAETLGQPGRGNGLRHRWHQLRP